MRRLPHIALFLSLSPTVACSPACTPPEAKNPEQSRSNGNEPTKQGTDEPEDPPIADADMIKEAPGVDLTKLSESQRSTFFQIINTEPSACDKPHSLAKSLRDDSACRNSMIVAQFAVDRLVQGSTVSAIKEELEIVADALKPRDVDIKGRPVWGNAHAPVTVVVFADFECPHCKAESPLLRQTVDQFGGKAKLVYKHFPLVAHPRAKMAAIAAEAAHEQDKFWPMHDILFANQTALEDKDIYRYAERIGLDMAKFKASYEARKGEKIVESDRAHGEDLGLEGTPTVFVNGRLFVQHDSLLGGTLAGWIDDALKR